MLSFNLKCKELVNISWQETKTQITIGLNEYIGQLTSSKESFGSRIWIFICLSVCLAGWLAGCFSVIFLTSLFACLLEMRYAGFG